MTARRYKVRGQDLLGTEIGRDAARVTLQLERPNWPFPQGIRAFDRVDLVRLDGGNSDDEPKQATPLTPKRARKERAS